MHTIARTTLLAAATPVLALALAATLAPASSSFSSSAPRTVLDVADLAQGAPPALAWSERRSGRTVIHGTGGTRTPVVNSLDQFAPMGSGYVVQTIGNRPSTTRWIAADGTPGRREWRTGYGFAVSPLRHRRLRRQGGKVWSIDQEGDRVLSGSTPCPSPARAARSSSIGEDCKEGERSQQRLRHLRQRRSRLVHLLARHRRPRAARAARHDRARPVARRDQLAGPTSGRAA